MAKPKGKIPSLLSMSTGIPTVHTCGKASPCDRCDETMLKGQSCFRIPKMKGGFTGQPLFCISCTKEIIQQTKAELANLIEENRHILL